MIYYFGTGEEVSMITNERYLTEEQRSFASLVVESESPAIEIEGKLPVRFIDPITKEFSWQYKDRVITDLPVGEIE